MANVWVQRVAGPGSAVTGVYAEQQPGIADEMLPDTDAAVVAYLTPPRTRRNLFLIAGDVFKLTGTLNPLTGQKALIAADLFAGNLATGSQKWQTNIGPNAAAMLAVYAAGTAANGVTTFNGAQQMILTAMYCQDNPRYLVAPTFDNTINVPGDQP
jgi:hypothetical protein